MLVNPWLPARMFGTAIIPPAEPLSRTPGKRHRVAGLARQAVRLSPSVPWLTTPRITKAFAIDKLLVLDEYLRTDDEAETVVDLADRNKAEIVIFSSEGDAGAKLKGFGKIAALLKFKLR